MLTHYSLMSRFCVHALYEMIVNIYITANAKICQHHVACSLGPQEH